MVPWYYTIISLMAGLVIGIILIALVTANGDGDE